MTAPVRVQLRRTRGWRMPPNTVKVDRTTKWGNPHVVGDSFVRNAADAVRKFRMGMGLEGGDFGPRPPHPDSPCGRMLRDICELRGLNLACWCPIGQPCHADVLLELANAGDEPGAVA